MTMNFRIASALVGLALTAGFASAQVATQWNFDGDLSASFGGAVLDYHTPAAQSRVNYGDATTFAGATPDGGNPNVAALYFSSSDHAFICYNNAPPNGGGIYTNDYTLIWDIYIPQSSFDNHDWLSFYMFTTFTDRDGKYQLLALSESGFDPLSRTCRFMLTEEAFHMSVGEGGVGRVVQRATDLIRQGLDDVRQQGAIDLPTVQKYLNYWFSLSLDLFGGEVSTNAAQYFASGLKGRYKEASYTDHKALEGSPDLSGKPAFPYLTRAA